MYGLRNGHHLSVAYLSSPLGDVDQNRLGGAVRQVDVQPCMKLPPCLPHLLDLTLNIVSEGAYSAQICETRT